MATFSLAEMQDDTAKNRQKISCPAALARAITSPEIVTFCAARFLCFFRIALKMETITPRSPKTMSIATIPRSPAPAAAISAPVGSVVAGTGNGAGKSGQDPAGAAPATPGSAAPARLAAEALVQITKLKARDLEVRQHEAAHMAVAGGLVTSGPSYTYQKGPDGQNYAIGGEVGIDTSPGRTPQETIERARRVQAAALAPAEPSGPDLAVAAQAQQMESQARSELALQRAAQLNQSYGVDKPSHSGALSVFA